MYLDAFNQRPVYATESGGMYAMSGITGNNGRIYKVNDTLDLFVAHAIKAAKQFIADHRMLTADWKA